jgi:hypothetical protein
MPSEGHARAGSVDRRTPLRCYRLAVTRPYARTTPHHSTTPPHTRPIGAIFWQILVCWHSCEFLAARDTVIHGMGHCSSSKLVGLRRAATPSPSLESSNDGPKTALDVGQKDLIKGPLATWQFVLSGQPRGPLRWFGRLCAHLMAPNEPCAHA